MAWMAVVNVLVYFHIAMASRAYLICLAGVVVEAAAIGAFHETAEQVAVATAIVAAVVAFLEYEAAASICRWRPQIAPPAGGRLTLSPSRARSRSRSSCRATTRAGAARGRRAALLGRSTRSAPTRSSSSPTAAPTRRSRRESFESEAVRVIDYPLREGKGHALRVGLAEARGEYVAFCDADGDIASEALPPFLTLMRLYDPTSSSARSATRSPTSTTRPCAAC